MGDAAEVVEKLPVEVAPEAKVTSTFYRITLPARGDEPVLCFGAFVSGGRVMAVPPAARRWRGAPRWAFLEHWRERGALIEVLDGAGQPVLNDEPSAKVPR